MHLITIGLDQRNAYQQSILTRKKIKEEHDVENDKSNMLIDANDDKHNALSCEDEK